MRCTVIGAGVIGLSCATRLRQAGHTVRLVADLRPAETTSAVAAAIWYPYLAAPRDRVTAWAADAYGVFTHPRGRAPGSGVRMLRGVELFADAQADPWWLSAVPDLGRLVEDELPTGMVDGWTFVTPVIDMPVYLGWMRDVLSADGVDLEIRRVEDLDHELTDADVVINCTGLASRELVDDGLLEAVRGQVVVLTNPGLTSWWLHEPTPSELTYVVPRLETVVVGGTAVHGADNDLTPDPAVGEAILERARRLVPGLADATVLLHRVGLRPARPEIRLEREDRPGGAVIHCYGHGGAGVTLSWGCADEVVELGPRCCRAEQLVPARPEGRAGLERPLGAGHRGCALDVEHAVQSGHGEDAADGRWHRAEHEATPGAVRAAVRGHEHAQPGGVQHGHRAEIDDEITDPEVDGRLQGAPQLGDRRGIHPGDQVDHLAPRFRHCAHRRLHA